MFKLSWIDDAIAVVQLDRLPANAFDDHGVSELFSLLESLADNRACRAVIFRGGERFFCAGADVKFMADHVNDPAGPEKLGAFAKRLQDAYARLEALRVPTIAALAGIATGGGFELALACDLRIADRSAKMGLPEVRLGLLPGAGGITRVVRIAGPAVANQIVLTGEILTAHKAAALGLIHEVVDDGQSCDRAVELCRSLVKSPKGALAAIKQCIALAPSEASLKAEIDNTIALQKQPETKAMIAAFIERSKSK